MARLPKKKKEKEARSHIYRVPLVALKVYDSHEEAEAGVDHCDKCDRQPRDEEWDDPQWVLTLGVTTKAQLAVARLCPDCWATMEFGDVYAPRGMCGPALPIGLADSPPNMIHGRRDEQQTA
jgi:hypothetical protein